MRKNIGAFALAALTALTLAGCGSSGAAQSATSSAASSASSSAASSSGSGSAADSVSTVSSDSLETPSANESSGSDSSDGAEAEGTLDSYSVENPVTVKVGLTAAIYEDIWNPIKDDLAKEGINIELVQFSDYISPDEALENDELTITSHQHHAFLDATKADQGWDDLVSAGDTFIIAMNLYSNKYDDVSEIQDGDQIAIPDDASNGGRALKLLANAGLIELSDDAGANPEVSDITKYNKQIDIVEMNASDVPSALADVDAAVVNGNYALDAGIDPDTAIYEESKYDDDSYFCLIAVKDKNKDTKAVKRIVERFQTDETKQIFQDEFKGYFKSAWDYKFS